jgi:UDP-N-acetylmuramate--L-alanine ligase/UDP-N-acetylenolpyruvoylglucosamine reductase
MMGIKGVAMSGLATVLHRMKADISGSDTDEYFQTEDVLKKYGIKIFTSFSAHHVTPDIDAMIITSAHGGYENIEVKKALELKIPVYTHAQFVGHLMKDFQNRVSVIGSHGKTTITAMISYCLYKAGESPTFLVGTSDFSGLDASHYGGKKYFIVEGDEYGNAPPNDLRPRFSFFPANWVVCPNVDFDHPDIYKDISDVKSKIMDFYNDKKPNFVAFGDDQNFNSLEIPSNKKFMYGYMDSNELVISDVRDIGETKFKLTHLGKDLGDWEIMIPGRQNIANAAAVVLLFIKLGLDIEKLRGIIKQFSGARRRFEKVCQNLNIKIYDDYAHHPKEIESTLIAIKNFFPNKKCLIIFQPHTYSRTYVLLNDFVEALKLTDMVFTTDIFPSAREKKADFPVESDDIQKKALLKGYKNIKYVSIQNLIPEVEKIISDYDIVFTMGAGDLYKKHEELCKLLKDHRRSLSGLTTFKMGGEVEHFRQVETVEQLVEALEFSKLNNLKYYLVGGGSNVVFTDKKIPGLLILNRISNKSVISETESELILEISSGYPLSTLVNELMQGAWSGFEWYAGMPGSMGGAVYMNSKWMKTGPHFIGDNLVSAIVLDKNGDQKKVDKNYFNFSYGYSELQKTGEILVSAQFKFVKGNNDEMSKVFQEVARHRISTQPKYGFNAGCFFKNVDNISAGKLIDDAGLKGRCIGQFCVSDIHANFIIHKGNGKMEDLMSLIEVIKSEVKDKFKVELQNEVEIIN